MSENIESCFINDQPEFYQKVMLDNQHIATIKMLSQVDMFHIENHLSKIYDPKLLEYEMTKAMMVLSLGGNLGGYKTFKGLAGWNLKNDKGQLPVVSLENYDMLLPKYKNAIVETYNTSEKTWNEIKAGILGN